MDSQFQKTCIERALEAAALNEELLAGIIEFFPYPIHVYGSDGTLILTNRAFINLFNIADRRKVVGRYNVLTDPVVEKWGIKEAILRSFRGETVLLYDVKAPIPAILARFGSRELQFSSLFQNISAFPIRAEDGALRFVATVFITTRLYSDKQEIISAKEYIEAHWREDFDIDKVARFVGLSRYHFARLFKKHTGATPYGYYRDIKINRLREALCDKNLLITEAFASCGLEYSGNYAKIFRDKVGMTPSQYRRTVV